MRQIRFLLTIKGRVYATGIAFLPSRNAGATWQFTVEEGRGARRLNKHLAQMEENA